ncbi:hypothetical protein ACFS5L_01000 [Streptomyces phyllanthi]|uniref:Lipoprotein n=1 Tax=Streptomyces phyllanthi TaxID=1803180 RepID=A0A5N8WDI8_9ACTN|nr:hypothetical protein [Streptomyces phyllanthi]MPY44876.1 hypothetical protein [Streptomyces phyllanthi]
MRTERTPWPPAAFGWAVGLALLAGGAATGCGKPGAQNGTGDGKPTGRAGSASPSPSATPPEDLCTQLIAYWSQKTLTGDTYGDYQSMGLSDGQYGILMKVVDAARDKKERAGTKAAHLLIDRRARELCEKRYRNGRPTGGPWH